MGSGEVARAFHDRTKHTYDSIRRGGRALDWSTKPGAFKAYDGSAVVELPTDYAAGDRLDLPSLARVLVYGAGVLRRQTVAEDVYYFRTYASAGALYPVEVYVVCDEIDDLDAGVYHFDPLHKRLVQLRRGSYVTGTCFVLTGIPWRTCWKYGERGYRHLFWDAGTILANVVALAGSARIVMGFDDAAVSSLLGVDEPREFPLCIVELESTGDAATNAEALGVQASYGGPGEERFAALEEVHSAGRLATSEVAAWRGRADATASEIDSNPLPGNSAERVIRRRGSARAFGSRPMPRTDLETVLAWASRPIPADYAPGHTERVRIFLAVHNVEGAEPGTYEWVGGDLRPLRGGDVRIDSAYLCLEQRLGGSGAATCFLMTDLDEALTTFGDRGYRVAQLEGGLMLGRLDLVAHALGWGATGLTFYDDEVTTFFSPAAGGLECMVVCAMGERRGRRLPLA